MVKANPKSAAPVQAVARAFGLLEALTAQDEMGLTELARGASLHPSTAHRLLASLIHCGYASQSPLTGRYRLGRKVLELARGSRALDAHLRSLARPHLEEIRAAVDETTNLVASEGMSAIYVDQVESRRPSACSPSRDGACPPTPAGQARRSWPSRTLRCSPGSMPASRGRG